MINKDYYKYDGVNAENEHLLMYFRLYSTVKLDPKNKDSDEYIHTGLFYSEGLFYLSRKVM